MKKNIKSFEKGEIVWDNGNNSYGVVLDTYGNIDSEIRLYSDGNQPIENLYKLGSEGDKGTKEQLEQALFSHKKLVDEWEYERIAYRDGGDIDDIDDNDDSDDSFIQGGAYDLSTKEKATMYAWISDFLENNTGDDLYEEFSKTFNKTTEQTFDIIDNGWAVSRGYYKSPEMKTKYSAGGSVENDLWSFESKLFEASLYYEESWIKERLPQGAVIDYVSAKHNNKYDAFRIKYLNQPDILKDGISPNLPVIERVWGTILVDYRLSEDSEDLQSAEILFDTNELPEFIDKDSLYSDDNKWGYVLYLNNSYVANFPDELEIDFKRKNIVIRFGNPEKEFDYYEKGGNIKEGDNHTHSTKHSTKNTGYDDEYMAMIQLDMVHRYAAKIDKMIDSGVYLEEWIKAKLSKVELMISSVKHALAGIEKFDDGGEMARKQLLHIGKYAAKLIEMLKSGSKLMSWMESDIAVCADYMDSIYHHLDYKSGNRATEMKYANGGKVEDIMSFEEFKKKLPILHDIKWGDNGVEYVAKYNPYSDSIMYFKHGRRNSEKVSLASAYEHYKYFLNKNGAYANGGNIGNIDEFDSETIKKKKAEMYIALNTKTGQVYVGGIKPKNKLNQDDKGYFLIDGYGTFMGKKYPIKKYFSPLENAVLSDYMKEEYRNGGGIKRKEYEVYHNTLYSVINEITQYFNDMGYEVGDFFPEFTHISYGTTFRTYADILSNGNVVNQINVQVYRMDSGRYELNMYPNKPIKKHKKSPDVEQYQKGGIYSKAIHLEAERFKNFKNYYSRIDENHLVGKERFLGVEYYVGFQKGSQQADWKYDSQDEALYTDMNVYEVAAITKGSIKPRLNENGGSISEEIKKGTEIELEHKKTIKEIQKNHNLSVRDAAELIAKDHIAENPNYYEQYKD